MNGGDYTTDRARASPHTDSGDGLALVILHCQRRDLVGKTVALREGARIELGRRPGTSGLVLDDSQVSRAHCAIEWRAAGDAFVLLDLRSTNGTRVNGQEVQTKTLEQGDILRVGDTILACTPFHRGIAGWSTPPDCALRGRSLALRRILDDVARAAPTDLTVLIEGDTGTGKELVAREIHRQSRRPGRFVPVNCASLPSALAEAELFGHVRGAYTGAVASSGGLVQAAGRGTLFLDEVGELPMVLQAKLLRVLEDRRVRAVGSTQETSVDVRFVAATNRDTAAAVAAGRFRGDLLSRLQEWNIRVPSLRSRPEDIAPIVNSVIAEHDGGRHYELAADYFEGLAVHGWPFGVRELRQVIRRALATHPAGARLERADLPTALRLEPMIAARPELPAAGAVPTRDELKELLRHYAGNVSAVARHAGCDRTQVYRWFKRFGFDPRQFRGIG